MIRGYPVFDADAHAMLCPKMWEELPASLCCAPAASGAHR